MPDARGVVYLLSSYQELEGEAGEEEGKTEEERGLGKQRERENTSFQETWLLLLRFRHLDPNVHLLICPGCDGGARLLLMLEIRDETRVCERLAASRGMTRWDY